MYVHKKTVKIVWGHEMKQYVWLEVLPQLLQVLFTYFTSFVIARFS
jgi:hypothetical protein